MVLSLVIDIAKKIADKCVDPVVGYFGTEVGHLWNYSANLKKLEEEVGHLNDATRRMNDRIEDAGNRSGETRVDAGAERWLTDMALLSDEASRIIKEEERETGRCLMGLRPNLWACYQASKSAKKVMDDAEELKKKGESIKKVAHNDYSQALGFEINRHFEELESRKKASEQIVAYLKDPSVKMVGMYGMGGTGKTTLAEKIGVQLYEDGTFRYVVKTVVSNNPKTDVIHIQKQIADLLKISLGDEKDDVMARATRLREQLVKKDKVLIILDDIWSSFELRDVGVPLDRELKVLITSRDVNLMNEMDSKHNVPLDDLSWDDSWKLFNRMADGVAPDRYSTAREVVERCGGIPVLLVTIARTLRKRDLETWNEALLQLKRFEGDKYVEDGYKRIEVSYNFLPNDELRSLFLLCAQLDHHSIPMDDLLRYTMGLGLFDKREKLREVRSRLHSHLGDLKGYCLLQEGNRKGTVRMHDVVHKFAAFVAYRDRRIFSTVAQDQLQEWPSKDKLEQFSAISLPYCHLPPPEHQLPVAFDSSKLKSFLLLRGKYEAFLNVPDEFFIGMKELKLVDIRRMSLSPVLLSSLKVLVNLRTLCLDYCALDDIAVIGDLPMLQVLSLKGSTVSQIRRLGSSLKLLDLSDCRKLKVIASGVFCKLTLLEDLRIRMSFHKWEPLQVCNNVTDHETSTTKKLASLREFKNLGNLINLDILIPDLEMFPKDLVFEKLERFSIIIGDGDGDVFWSCMDDSGNLKVKLREDFQLYKGITVLMRKAKELHLEEIQGVTSVCELLDMRELERMCDDHRMVPVGSLQNLTTIEVSNCFVLKYLFSSHLALRGLSCLKEISVGYCESMESIVSRECENKITDEDRLGDEEEEIIKFPQLRKLELTKLVRLISFYSSSTPNPIISSSQERQEKDPMSSNQRLSTSFFNKKVVLSKLEVLQLWWLKVDRIWDDQLTIDAQRINCCFQNLTFLKVWKCHNLSYLFTSSMVTSLAQLKELQVHDCESIEEIVVATKGEMAGDEEEIIEFTHLRILDLNSLDRLISFYSSSTPNPIISSSQERQEQQLPTSLFNKKVAFPNLEEVKICHIHKVKMIWENQLLLNLGEVTVSSCRNLTSIFPASVALTLKQLENLRITGCENLKEIVSNEEEEDGGPTFVFPKLTSLYLQRLPELERFYPGDDISDWPCLNELDVSYCDKLIEPLSMQKIISPSLETCNIMGTNFKVSYSTLFGGELRLIGLSKMKHIWSEQHADGQFYGIPLNLTILEVEGCGSLMSLASKSALFQNLTRLVVTGCNELIKLVSSTTAKSLVNLIEMRVSKCDSLIEIVAIYDDHDGKEASNNSTKDIVFGKLETLELESLRSLTSFTTNNCNFQFPSLEEVIVVQCPNMKFFSMGAFSTPKLSEVWVDNADYDEEEGRNMWESDLNSTVRQLYKEMIISPCLKTCNIKGTNVGVRYNSLFGELEVDGDIKNIGCSSGFPIALFEIFQKLEMFPELKTVHVAGFCFEQLLPCEPDVGDDHDIDTQAIAKTLARTKHLKLSGLSKMKHIWSEQYADDHFYCIPLNLEILEVEGCGSLMSLAPKSALFQNLTHLVVTGCDELVKLIASSTTAKSLVNLIEMRVSKCDSLIEIVATYDDHDGEEASNNSTEDIVFGKLETLELESLRSLTSFTSNNCNFQFPSLEQVTVAECPNMKFFSKGALSTPKLSGVWIEEEGRVWERRRRSMWESDLNSTVRQLYKEMNSTN